MVYTTHKDGDEWGMVYGIAIPTLTIFSHPKLAQNVTWEVSCLRSEEVFRVHIGAGKASRYWVMIHMMIHPNWMELFF